MPDTPIYPLGGRHDHTIRPELLADVQDVLVRHGFPSTDHPGDRVRLRAALAQALYGEVPASPAGALVVQHTEVVERGASVTGLVINGPL